MSTTMTKWGVGPRFVLVTALFTGPAIAARMIWPEVFRIPFVPRTAVVVAAVLLLLAGIPMFVVALRTLAKGFPQGKLFTGGVYALCRDPIYACWVVFNVPAASLLSDSWLGLLLPVPMYITLRVLVREEEVWLERTFGDEYRAYRARVRPVLPIPRRR